MAVHVKLEKISFVSYKRHNKLGHSEHRKLVEAYHQDLATVVPVKHKRTLRPGQTKQQARAQL